MYMYIFQDVPFTQRPHFRPSILLRLAKSSLLLLRCTSSILLPFFVPISVLPIIVKPCQSTRSNDVALPSRLSAPATLLTVPSLSAIAFGDNRLEVSSSDDDNIPRTNISSYQLEELEFLKGKDRRLGFLVYIFVNSANIA